MGDETMPHVVEARYRKRTLYIDNLITDRHTDTMLWTADPDDGSEMVRLSEAQVRNLSATLSAYVALWDAENL